MRGDTCPEWIAYQHERGVGLARGVGRPGVEPKSGDQPHAKQRVRRSLATAPGINPVQSSAFVGASLQHLIAAARLPNSGISEIAVNASLASSEGAKPRDEIECALVVQMACTHSAAMAVLNRLGGAAGDRTVAGMASAADAPDGQSRELAATKECPRHSLELLRGRFPTATNCSVPDGQSREWWKAPR